MAQAARIWRSLSSQPRAPGEPTCARQESGELHGDRRGAARVTAGKLRRVAPPSASQSTPPWLKKRLSSAATTASRMAGLTSSSFVQPRRRAW